MKDIIEEIENMIAEDHQRSIEKKDLMNNVLAKSQDIMENMKKPNIIKEKIETMEVTIPINCVCGIPWVDGAKFCRECGSPMPKVEVVTLTCSNGHDITPDAKFCPICGVRIIS